MIYLDLIVRKFKKIKMSKKNLLKNFSRLFVMEATTGFEPVIRVLQTRALPLGYVAITTLV